MVSDQVIRAAIEELRQATQTASKREQSIPTATAARCESDGRGPWSGCLDTWAVLQFVKGREEVAREPSSTLSYRKKAMKTRSPITFVLALFVSLAMVVAAPAGPPVVTFKKIADWNTPIPEGTGNFSWFGLSVGLRGNEAVFAGGGESESGVYAGDGESLNMIADSNTPIPEGTGTFRRMWRASVGDEFISFLGFGEEQEGIYRSTDGVLSLVADLNTQIPDSSELFREFESPGSSGTYVAFTGEGRKEAGIYRHDGRSLSTVVDRSTAVPGRNTEFVFFGEGAPGVWENDVAFWGFSAHGQGIYHFDGDSRGIRTIAERLTPIPGGLGTFSDFAEDVSLSGSNVAFYGEDDGETEQGVYAFIDGRLEVVADLNTTIPDGNGVFRRFLIPVISGTNVAFTGYGQDGQSGIYARIGGTLFKVLSLDDTLEDRKLEYVAVWHEGMSGNRMGFWVFFSDPPGGGIYIADITGVQCSDNEKLAAKCRQNRIKARTRRGLPDVTLTFCLDDQQCIQAQAKPNGRAKAQWKNAPPGKHTVQVRECGLQKDTNC